MTATHTIPSPRATPPTAGRRPRRRGGFSFVEVLFAVMILGIGFIMLAGIFPVAMRQAADTLDETLAMSMARKAATVLGDSQILGTIPNNGNVVRIELDPWLAVKGNQINPDDPRYAWVALARRVPVPNPSAPDLVQLVVVPVQVRAQDRSRFDQADLTVSGNSATLLPVPVKVRFTAATSSAGSQCTVVSANGTGVSNGDGPQNPAATGGVVVIATGSFAGRSVRLGAPVNDSTVQYELMPGSDLNDLGGSVPPGDVDAFIVGRGLSNPGAGSPTFSGPSMAVGLYTTYVRVK
ncbi:MAG TPA: prepilin-type N-terminal cleavage/methylation domain-containing protein [Humisphaera sp.]